MDSPPLKQEGEYPLRRSARKLKRESAQSISPTKIRKIQPKNVLSFLADDLIGRILFSGYLSKSWYSTICLVLVCKKFKDVGKTYIAYVKNKHRIEVNARTLQISELSVLGIGRIAPHLVYLDLSFSDNIAYNAQLGSMLVSLGHSLRGLSLRCTKVDNAFLSTYVSQLSLLKFLDVSQGCTADKALVTDLGALPLANLKSLKWLNLSMCNITDATIVALSKSAPLLEHLALYGCSALTDASLKAVTSWKLHTLDVSNCALLTLEGLEYLVDPRTPICSTLVNLAASFLPNANASSVKTLPVLLKLPKLRRLEFRKKTAEVVPVPDKLEKQVRAQLEVAILKHSDQLKGLQTLSIIEPSPPLTSLCPVLCWPYSTTEL